MPGGSDAKDPFSGSAGRRATGDCPPHRWRAGMRLLATLAVCAMVAGCGGDDKAPSARLRIDVIGDVGAAQADLQGPRQAWADATQIGLVDLDAQGQVVPALATSWRVSDDGLSYIFRLRDNARWEDERAIDAGDVVAVMRRVMAPESEHPLKPLLRRVENAPEVAARRKPAKALGVLDPLPNIVEIRLTSPQPQLLQMLAHPSLSIMRRGDFPPAAGAFRLVDAKARPLRLRRNPSYFDAGSVALASVELMPMPEAVEAIGRFRRGATDVVTGGTLAGLGEASAVPVPRAFRTTPTYGAYGYVANLRSGPLVDVRVRRALGLAVDRETLAQRSIPDTVLQPIYGLVPPNLPSYGAPAEPPWLGLPPEARVAEARALLADAGYGPDRPLAIEVSLPASRDHSTILAAVARDWAAVGVRTRAATRSAAAHAEAVAAGKFQLALVERISPVDSGYFFLAPFACAAKSGYCNREADRLLDATRTISDLDLRRQALRNAELLIAADQPAIMLFVPVRWSLVHPRVSGWADNVVGAHPLSRLDVLPERTGDAR